MHTEGIIHSRYYFKLFPNFFDPQSSLLSSLHTHSENVCLNSIGIMQVTFNPGNSAHIYNMLACSRACNKGGYLCCDRNTTTSNMCQYSKLKLTAVSLYISHIVIHTKDTLHSRLCCFTLSTSLSLLCTNQL